MPTTINGMPIGDVNAEPADGDTPIIVFGAAGAAIHEYAALVADGSGAFRCAIAADAPCFAGLAPHKTRLKTGGTVGQYEQYDHVGRVVSGVYPAIIEKTAAEETAETIEPGCLVAIGAGAGQLKMSSTTPVARMVDRVYFAADEVAGKTVIARVVIP